DLSLFALFACLKQHVLLYRLFHFSSTLFCKKLAIFFRVLISSLFSSILDIKKWYSFAILAIEYHSYFIKFYLPNFSSLVMTFIPCIYGCKASGTFTVPSSFWLFSIIAATVLPTARPEPFKVCAK